MTKAEFSVESACTGRNLKSGPRLPRFVFGLAQVSDGFGQQDQHANDRALDVAQIAWFADGAGMVDLFR